LNPAAPPYGKVVASAIVSLSSGEPLEDRQGLHMLHPRDPNKIPVVFVHGSI
jgi:hypothetical protein